MPLSRVLGNYIRDKASDMTDDSNRQAGAIDWVVCRDRPVEMPESLYRTLTRAVLDWEDRGESASELAVYAYRLIIGVFE